MAESREEKSPCHCNLIRPNWRFTFTNTEEILR